MARTVDGLRPMAALSNVSVPTLRFWAATRGELLGIEPLPDGEWRFSPAAVQFFVKLGAPSADEAPSEGRPPAPETKFAAARPPTGDDELAALAAHVADLAEEAKQMQVLLSRIIELLTPPGPSAAGPRVVRAWRPRRVTSSAPADHRLDS